MHFQDFYDEAEFKNHEYLCLPALAFDFFSGSYISSNLINVSLYCLYSLEEVEEGLMSRSDEERSDRRASRSILLKFRKLTCSVSGDILVVLGVDVFIVGAIQQ